MPLTDAQRKRYANRGLAAEEIDELEAILDEPDEGEGKGSGSGRRVIVYEGEDAEGFMERLFGSGGGEDKGKGKGEDKDGEPAGGPKWFK